MSTVRRKTDLLKKDKPKTEGYSPTAFWILVAVLIIIFIILIIFIFLYSQRNQGLIDPNECPEQITGTLAVENTDISTLASNCGNVANCTYEVNSLADAKNICLGLGNEKCKLFSLAQIPLSNSYTMKVSDNITTTSSATANTFRIIL